jgi:mono/diheme cytochrome c family protein
MRRIMTLVALIYGIALAGAIAAQPSASGQASEGQQTFRYDTFGDEQLWTDELQMHQAIALVSPAAALRVGLKVDRDALPRDVVAALRKGLVDLNDPAVTVQLLALNAVVGVIGRVSADGALESIGITCALCHSTVDNSLTAGVGRRLDGPANRDLDVGAIIAMSPVLTAEEKKVLSSWGRGKFDPRLQIFDGTNRIPLIDETLPVLIPPIYGLRGVGVETYTADGPISYWNNYVGVTQMGGQGTFEDTRISVSVTQEPDLVTPKLPALLEYQLRLRPPAPPRGSFDQGAARRGERLFSGLAGCARCHTPPLFTDVLRGPDPTVPLLHAPSEIGAESVYASRSATGMYRTTPLRGIWQHPPYFHDGSAADLSAVVDRYDTVFSLGLTAAQKEDLVQFLKSL